MREIDEILNDKRIKCIYRCVNDEKATQLKMEMHSFKSSDKCLVKFTKCVGWEHLSVSHKNKIPSWETMQEMKEIFWTDDEICMQLHPKKSEYINNDNYTLHIWKPLNEDIPTPPSILVGFRPGKEAEDRKWFKQMQEQLGNPLTDDEIDILINPEKLKNMDLSELLKYIKFI